MLQMACGRATGSGPIEAAKRYLDDGDPTAASRFSDALEYSVERPPHQPIDLTRLRVELGRSLTDSGPRRERAVNLTCRILVSYRRAVSALEDAPHTGVDRSILVRLLPPAAAGAARAHQASPRDRYACLELFAGLVIDEPHSLLDAALETMKPGSEATLEVAHRYQKVRWTWRQHVVWDRLRRDRSVSLARGPARPVSRCAEALRTIGWPDLPPPVLGVANLESARVGSPITPGSQLAARRCDALLARLECAPQTCEARLIGELATADVPLPIRRLHLTLALLEAGGGPSDETSAAILTSRLAHCGDPYKMHRFCAPAVLGLVADGTLSEPEAGLLMDANQLAWELVDRPDWLAWPTF